MLGLVVRIVQNLNFEVLARIVELRNCFDQALDDIPLIINRQLNRNFRPGSDLGREPGPDVIVLDLELGGQMITEQIPGLVAGGRRIVVIAGPCAVESEAQVEAAAAAVKRSGATLLRGGAFKPRTSPYSFQGMEDAGLELLENAGRHVGLPVVTEIMDPHDIDLVAEHADMLQVGARNAQNFSLLRRLGKVKKPVLLKRGMSTRLEEFLMAAEYILSAGNPNVVLCERGIRTFETATRNTLDLTAVPLLKQWTHLPVVVDPSHGTGIWSLVTPMALAAVAAGADGLLIEVHPSPETALSDGPQQLRPERFAELMTALKAVAEAVGRTL